jgi:hypothetical protein
LDNKGVVALFMDGTTNFKDDTQAHPWTNVAFLSEWVPDDLPPGAERYVRGVGSDDAESVESLAGVRNLFGRILGYGLTGKVRAVYESLCRYHADQKDIYLFGFSLGACAARVVAGFVDEVGILLADKLDRVDDAWEIYISSPAIPMSQTSANISSNLEMRDVVGRHCHSAPYLFSGCLGHGGDVVYCQRRTIRSDVASQPDSVQRYARASGTGDPRGPALFPRTALDGASSGRATANCQAGMVSG